jgi:hypothetical protein
VVGVGRGCGISIEKDELVEGLSVWAIRGVILANRTKETREITLIVEGSGGSDDRPAVLLDGQVADLGQCL